LSTHAEAFPAGCGNSNNSIAESKIPYFILPQKQIKYAYKQLKHAESDKIRMFYSKNQVAPFSLKSKQEGDSKR